MEFTKQFNAKTADGNGEVTNNSIVKEIVKVKIKKNDEEIIQEYNIRDIELVSGEYEDSIDDSNIKLEIESDEDKALIKDLINEK